jgi:hypothetical protein
VIREKVFPPLKKNGEVIDKLKDYEQKQTEKKRSEAAGATAVSHFLAE